ncbi:unnamed protein product [Spirodela intermedia]|uniref:Uncharacterized protein n=1 Tax=Spirodela intermedia TaxID=51605 RepID=A0ABN7E994_SPIIN|nr:unnamed protein product [Spirodela intermedia]
MGDRRPAGPASGSEAQSGSSREQGLKRLAWIGRGTCVPLPFHVTGGQPAVGQGVVVHFLFHMCTTTLCPTAGWPPVMWKGSGAHVPPSV